MIDLHIHTSYSDGTDSIVELIDKLKEKGITEFSITDHNTVSATKEIFNGQKKYGLKYIPGVEFSVLYNDEEYHVTAYGRKLLTQKVEDICNENSKLRNKCDIYLVENLLSEINIKASNYETYEYDRSEGWWKSFHYLKDIGVFEKPNEYFSLDKKYGQKPQFILAKELLGILNKIGLYSVLAHPQQVQQARHGNDFIDLAELYEWKEMGIQGIEIYNPYFKDPKSLEYYRDFCRNNGLFITGGSDYHGKISSKKLGCPALNRWDLDIEQLKEEFIYI